MITLAQFIAEWTGKGVNPDKNQYGFQCVELVNEWLKELGLPMLPWTNAQDFDDKLKGDTAHYVWIPNSPTNMPKPGDIVVWQDPNLPFGHVDIAVDQISSMSFRGFDQNWPLNSLPHLQTHTYIHPQVEGWLHLKMFDPAPVVVDPKDALIADLTAKLRAAQIAAIAQQNTINGLLGKVAAAKLALN